MARGGQFEMAGTSCSIFDRSFSFRFIMEFLGVQVRGSYLVCGVITVAGYLNYTY